MTTPRVINIRPVTGHSAIKARFDIQTACGLTLHDVMLFEGPNGPWFTPQGIPQLDAEGRHRVVGGKRLYTRHITFSDSFKAAVLAQLGEARHG
jgi:hypothetical protein